MELAPLQYKGVCLTENIEKHAAAPLYTEKQKHPHPDYKNYERLKITKLSKELIQLKNRYLDQAKAEGKHWLDYIKVRDLKCRCPNKILYEKIIDPTEPHQDEVMCYNACKHTIFAAAKRQMKAAPTPDPKVADDFLQYSKNIIDNEIGDELKHFGYSYEQWYNHLSSAKQQKADKMMKYLKGDTKDFTQNDIKWLKNENYEGICKIELQKTDGKPRMVCSIPLIHKVATGPITWQLEEIMAKKFKGYCGGKNLDEMADMVNEYIQQGFTKVVEGDGSAFDNTQDITLKRVDQYLYDQVEHAVYHVPKQLFRRITHKNYKVMDVNYIGNDRKKHTLMTYEILGSVFSGDCDTTLCNTMRMALYNRYVNDKAGLVYGKDYVAYSKGDDFTVQYKPYVSDEFIKAAYYKYFLPASSSPDKADTRVYGLGQVLKMLDFGKPDSIKFCSLRAWYADANCEKIILTRDPKKLFNLSKYSRKIKTLPIHMKVLYHYELAQSYLTSYKGIDIFEIAAEMHIATAKALANTIKRYRSVKFEKLINKLRSKLIQKCRHQIPHEKPEILCEDENNKILYNIKEREMFYKIQNDYWTTMQAIERVRTRILTEQEAYYVNQQINAEFAVEELRSVLGLIKSYENNHQSNKNQKQH